MTHEQIRSFLTALAANVNEALSLVAGGHYDEAAEELACAGPDVMNVLDSLRELAAVPRCGCRDVCSDCAPLNVGDWS